MGGRVHKITAHLGPWHPRSEGVLSLSSVVIGTDACGVLAMGQALLTALYVAHLVDALGYGWGSVLQKRS